MDEITITGQQKHENFKIQFTRLNKALNNGFNLEAMFIEYAIIEDRTESVLRHAELWEKYLHKRGGREITLNSKVKYIQNCASTKIAGLDKYFSDDLLDQILVWKEDRNRLIHDLLSQQLAHNEVADIALKGNELTKTLRTRATNYSRKMERQKKTE